MDFEALFNKNKEDSLQGRYIINEDIIPILQRYNLSNNLSVVGNSVLGKPIYEYHFGEGKTKILMWSQMHGNESTTTKAVMDLISFLNSNEEICKLFNERFSLKIIPILNPDGAQLYTRTNANDVDLNRDSQNLTQPESKILREIFDQFSPDLCLNLHDQRTIFGVGKTGKPATVSFLSPSFDTTRKFNSTRKKAIAIINSINDVLQQVIPGQVGRFDDSFNENCIGDQFTMLGTPTILFEAGHFQGDYNREETRKLIFISLLETLVFVYENDIVEGNVQRYESIEENNVIFFDIIFKNIKINYGNSEKITNFAVQFTEILSDNRIVFDAFIVKIDELDEFYGHLEYDCLQNSFLDIQHNDNIIRLGSPATFKIGNDMIVINGKVSINAFKSGI